MKIDFSDIKFFTILLAILYIFGLICVFYNCEILCAFLVLLFLIFAILKLKISSKKSIILYLIFFLGFIRAKDSTNIQSILDEVRADDVVLSGQIISSQDISHKNKKIKFFLRADEANIFDKNIENVKAKVLVSLDLASEIEKEIMIGDYIKIKGNLRTPKEAKNPHQFDYKKYLANKDCKNILYGDYLTFEKIAEPEFGKNKADSWYFILKQFEITRKEIIKKHSKNIKSPNLEILAGIVFGNETINPDDTVKENFKNAGLLHLLAASGLNVALIYGIWWWIANLLRFPYHFSILSGAVFVVFYTFMTGFPPSILRASLMLLFVLFGKLIDRNADSVALIAFVGFLILLFEPKMLFDIGFQLSFAVTLGLVMMCPMLISKFENYDKKFIEKYKNSCGFLKTFIMLFSPKNLAAIVAVPLVAQICVMPLQMHYFNSISLLSLFANIAVVPFIGVLSFVGFLSSILALIPHLNEPFVYFFDAIANPMLSLLINISKFFSALKFSLVTTVGLNIFQICVFWLFFYFLILAFKNSFKNKKELVIIATSFLLFVLSFIKLDYFKNDLEVIMFDVSNADSFLIKTPKNKYIMIDTGAKIFRSTTSAEIIINKYLKNERIKNLKTLIVTHFDLDHSGGVVDVLANTKTDAVILQKTLEENKSQKEILDYLKNNNLKFDFAQNNKVIYEEKDLKIKTFIFDFDAKSNKDVNESSVITLLTYKNKNVLFMADAGVVAFEQIEKYLPEKIDIIKIGHHGAKNSVNDKMLNRIKPDWALISVGANKFNLPDACVIEKLLNKNIKMVSSKNYGFSKIKLKDDDIRLYHFDGKDKKLKRIIFENKDKNLLLNQKNKAINN